MPRLLSYSTDQAALVTRAPVSLLREWENEAVVRPRSTYLDRRGERHALYTFEHLVDISALLWLRGQLPTQPPMLKTVMRALAAFSPDAWTAMEIDSSETLIISGVAMETRVPLNVDVSGRAGLSVRREDIERTCELRTTQLQERTTDQVGRVVQNQNVRNGQPVLAGTRIPTIAIQEFHDAGYSVTELLDQYPRLTPADVEAALVFEAESRSARKAS